MYDCCRFFVSFQIQEQAIIDDIMDLEDKFADTLGPIPYFDSSAGMIVPQTVSCNNANMVKHKQSFVDCSNQNTYFVIMMRITQYV